MTYPSTWIILEEAEYLLGCGESYQAVAAVLRLKPDSLTRCLQRNGREHLIPEGWR